MADLTRIAERRPLPPEPCYHDCRDCVEAGECLDRVGEECPRGSLDLEAGGCTCIDGCAEGFPTMDYVELQKESPRFRGLSAATRGRDLSGFQHRHGIGECNAHKSAGVSAGQPCGTHRSLPGGITDPVFFGDAVRTHPHNAFQRESGGAGRGPLIGALVHLCLLASRTLTMRIITRSGEACQA